MLDWISFNLYNIYDTIYDKHKIIFILTKTTRETYIKDISKLFNN